MFQGGWKWSSQLVFCSSFGEWISNSALSLRAQLSAHNRCANLWWWLYWNFCVCWNAVVASGRVRMTWETGQYAINTWRKGRKISDSNRNSTRASPLRFWGGKGWWRWRGWALMSNLFEPTNIFLKIVTRSGKNTSCSVQTYFRRLEMNNLIAEYIWKWFIWYFFVSCSALSVLHIDCEWVSI